MDYVLSSLDMYADMTENLINYTFNVRSTCVAHPFFVKFTFSATDGLVPDE